MSDQHATSSSLLQSGGSIQPSGEKFWRLIREHDQPLEVPEAYTRVPNPEFEKWIERAALILCIEAEECGVIPTPCVQHLSQARYLVAMRQVTSNG